MSLVPNLKMVATIKRLPTNIVKDDYSSYEPSWETISDNVKCFIYTSDYNSGRLKLTNVGQDSEDMYIGIFNKNEDIKVGDMIVCSSFFNDLYVRSIGPVTNARTGKVHHLECTLGKEL